MSKEQQQIFETIYRDHHAMVLQVCTGFLKGDTMQAQDLTQEIFINTWNALPNYRGDSSYKTWLYRITVNTCLQHLRKKKLTTNTEITSLPELPSESNSNRSYNQLYRAIGQLEEMDRLIIMMVLDEMEYAEIGKVTGISEGNLRVKIHRIKTKLKKIMHHE